MEKQTMKYLPIALLFLLACPAIAQDEPTLATPDLEQRVRDIAGLVVSNTDALSALRDRVAAIESKNSGILGRLIDLENNVFGLGDIPAPIIKKVAPVVIRRVVQQYIPPTSTYRAPPPPQPRIKTVYPRQITIQRGGRTVPQRGFFRKLLFGRRLLKSVSTGSSSSHWTHPGDIVDHLIGPPHNYSLGYVLSLNREQQLTLHDNAHTGRLRTF
jgi:hypothetical protein